MKIKTIYISVFAILLVSFVCSCARSSSRNSISGANPERSSIPHPRVHFLFDQDDVIFTEMIHLDKNAEWMKLNRNAVIILEGHCDELGPTDYNMELGDRRARTVKAHLVERGVPYERIIMVVSFGDTRPLDPSHSNKAWKKNRRVEFILR